MMNGTGNPPQQQPQPPDGNIQVPITMTINTWNNVLALIVEGPWKVADPLVREIHKQIQEHLNRLAETGAMPSGMASGMQQTPE